MYEAFYGLSEPPFRLTPDPHFLYLSAQHREALGHLLYGLREGSGFVAVTGEIGTGKTTLLRTLLRDLEPDTRAAYLFNPALSDVELLQTINGEFGLPNGSTSKRELIDALNGFLLQQKLAGRRAVVIVDEAQNLPPSTLEQLRLLSNLETETDKLLQIVLVGQPELRVVLRRPELAQLNQRITVRWHLEPLDRHETARYVRHRLRVAGGVAATAAFSAGALRAIHRYAGGVPRLINIAAHRALLAGYTAERRPVGTRLARRALAELRDIGGSSRPIEGLVRRAVGAAAAALALGVAVALAVLRPAPPAAPPSTAPDAPMAGAGPTARLDGRPEARARDRSDDGGSRVLTAATEREERRDVRAPLAASAPTAEEPAATPPSPATRSEGEDGASEPHPETAAPPDALAATTRDTATPASALAADPSVPQPTAGEAAAFWAALGALDSHVAAAAATETLLSAWRAEPLRSGERTGARLDLGSIAARRGLRYLPTSGTLARMRLLNLPVILELSVPPAGRRRAAVLTGVAGDSCVVRTGDSTALLTAAELERAWLGDAHVLWRDFENLSPYLTPGSTGPEVERLQRLLSRAGEYADAPSLRYDVATTEAIARFQRSRYLVADGIVGPLTKIVLYGAIAAYDQPRLGG